MITRGLACNLIYTFIYIYFKEILGLSSPTIYRRIWIVTFYLGFF